MKHLIKSVTVLSFFLLLGGAVIAQPSITLEAFGGWLWTGKAGYNNTIKVTDVGNYGVRGGVAPQPGMVVEFEWNHTEPAVSYYDYVNNENIVEDVIFNYYMLGFNKEISDGPLVPYGLLNIGVLNVKGKVDNWSENWFTVGLGGGAKIYITDNIGIRLQARLLLPMQFAGIGFGCGGGGCSSGVSTYTNTIQGDFTGGVILKIGG